MLGNTALQKHFLAVDTPNMESAVRAGNEYLQIQSHGQVPGIRVVQQEEEEIQ